MNPGDYHYHKEHTWVKVSGNKATIGITDYAQESLGDIVYIDMPELDAEIEAGSEMSEIESTKATSPMIAPVSGVITSVNEDLEDAPELMNDSPYEKGWVCVVKMSNPSEVEDLMDSTDYDKFVEEEAE